MIPVITLSDNILSLLVWQHPILPPLHKVHSMSLPITHTIPNLGTLTNFQPTISKRGKRHQEKGQLSAVLLSYTHPAGTLCSNKPEIVFSGHVVGFKSYEVLGGTELLFFTVPSMGLCFGFLLELVLITPGFFFLLSSACTEPSPSLLLSLHQEAEQAAVWCLGDNGG